MVWVSGELRAPVNGWRKLVANALVRRTTAKELTICMAPLMRGVRREVTARGAMLILYVLICIMVSP